MFGKTVTIVSLAAAIALLLILQSTNPASAGPGGVLAVFFLLYCILVGCLTWAIKGANWLLANVGNPFRARRPISEMNILQAYYLASVGAMGPIMLIGILSVGSIGLYEIGLVIIFEIISLFYVKKRFQ